MFHEREMGHWHKVLRYWKNYYKHIHVITERDGTRTLMGGGGGVSVRIFKFCPTSLFSNQIQIDQFQKKLVGQNMNMNVPDHRLVDILDSRTHHGTYKPACILETLRVKISIRER